MRVLHVIARMNVGGTARYVSHLVSDVPGENLLAAGTVQGSEVEDPVVAELPVVRIAHLGRKIDPINDFKAYLELRKIVKEFNPDLIHSHTFKAGLIARALARRNKKVHTFHGHLFDDSSFSSLAKLFITTAERISARRTDFLISVGERVGVELRDKGVGRNKPWASIKPGVDALARHDKTSARTSLGLPEGLIVGWMARVTAVKNPQLFLEVVRALPEITFALAGGGDLLDEIRTSAPGNLIILGWSDASLFWSAVDLAISTSDNEGMPIALIEAQLAGVPVIATNVGSNAEVISDGVTGIVTSKDVAKLVAAVRALATDEELRSSMSVAAAHRAEREFSLAAMIESHHKVYLGLSE